MNAPDFSFAGRIKPDKSSFSNSENSKQVNPAYIQRTLKTVLASISPDAINLADFDGQLLRVYASLAAAENFADVDKDKLWYALLAAQLAHEASLAHDDVIDDAKMRREKETDYSKQGTAAALLKGDLLLTLAYKAAAMTANPDLTGAFAEAVYGVVSGEKLQGVNRGKVLESACYRSIIEGKTGRLFAFAVSAPAILCASNRTAEYYKAGLAFGSFYQMFDDFLDPLHCAETGKTPGTDFRNRNWSFINRHMRDFSFELSENEMRAKLFEPQHPALDAALSELSNEADLLKKSLSRLFSAGSVLIEITDSWIEKAQLAARSEKGILLLDNCFALPQMQTYTEALSACDLKNFFALNSRSFSFASRLFPQDAAEKTRRLYAFCRITDDLADCTRCFTEDDRRVLLSAWLNELRLAVDKKTSRFVLINLLAEDMRENSVSIHYAEELVAGMMMDLSPRRYRSLEDLKIYTYRAASVVGMWMTELFGTHDTHLLRHAADLGHAMQLTNILRDVGEDLEMGRIYLPMNLMEKHFVSEADLLEMKKTAVIHAGYKNLVMELMQEADALYASSFPALAALPGFFSRPSALASAIYKGIHREILNNGCNNLTLRAHTGTMRKVSLALRALFQLGSLPSDAQSRDSRSFIGAKV